MSQDLEVNNSTVAQEGKRKVSPPYIPFLTFNNMITWLESEGVPVKFDRSFWGKKYGGGLGLQLIAGLRFLGLLKDDYTQPLLGEIVRARGEERKKRLADLVQKSYSASVDFSLLSGATPSMLKEWFAGYNLDGSTERKARSFFVNACKAYGVTLSKSLSKTARNKQASGTPREKKSEKPKEITEDKGDGIEQNPLSSHVETGQQHDLYRILLSDGCELKLCANRVFFELEKVDRELVENLVEIMKKHRKSKASLA